MKKGYSVLVSILIIAVLSGCGGKQDSSNENKQADLQEVVSGQTNAAPSNHNSEMKSAESTKAPPIIDHLDSYPFPVPSGWKEEKFEVREYDEGMDWEAVFTFEGDEQEHAAAYKEVLEGLGYEIQRLLSDEFKIGMAEFAGLPYHGTFSFEIGDEYSEWGEGQGYVEVSFSERR